MTDARASSALQGCYVISLRPVGGHAALRRAAARHGARVLALSPWRLVARDDAGSARELRRALSAPRVIFTSPAAVRAARALLPLRPRQAQAWLGVGAGTRDALRRAGVAGAIAPARMDSEGLLALPALREVDGEDVGLVTAPGGRGRIGAELRRRGARVLRADVYARVATAPSPRALAQLRATTTPLLLALSSGEALQRSLAALPADAVARLRGARVIAASARLAALARRRGFTDIAIATDARPRSLLAAALERGAGLAIR
ncbi:uroporphyrinogen-III synthase [Luteimonas sp. R10]|uniref:uroporphyrinogen-III synthase n=1 Tax=Luteimonas sp. R10 TaxID=3108176 RepID=UPI00308EF31D|nr:uroporphyrinogen-III synthase [Luteimonas sp. R10]